MSKLRQATVRIRGTGDSYSALLDPSDKFNPVWMTEGTMLQFMDNLNSAGLDLQLRQEGGSFIYHDGCGDGSIEEKHGGTETLYDASLCLEWEECK